MFTKNFFVISFVFNFSILYSLNLSAQGIHLSKLLVDSKLKVINQINLPKAKNQNYQFTTLDYALDHCTLVTSTALFDRVIPEGTLYSIKKVERIIEEKSKKNPGILDALRSFYPKEKTLIYLDSQVIKHIQCNDSRKLSIGDFKYLSQDYFEIININFEGPRIVR
jgi:hypothetical protein